MIGVLTAAKRASVAEALMIYEQVFRMLLDKEYSRASRLLEIHSDLLASFTDVEPPVAKKRWLGSTVV